MPSSLSLALGSFTIFLILLIGVLLIFHAMQAISERNLFLKLLIDFVYYSVHMYLINHKLIDHLVHRMLLLQGTASLDRLLDEAVEPALVEIRLLRWFYHQSATLHHSVFPRY